MLPLGLTPRDVTGSQRQRSVIGPGPYRITKLTVSALRSTISGRKNDPRRIYDWGLRIRAIFPMMLRQFAFHRLLLVERLRTQERKRQDVSRYCVAPWGCGGTGRRAGFRIQCPWTCRFDSCHPH